ncbi:MAG: hypothetical protein ABSF46_02015 [Terriglobia bacterium]|jgi:tRNA C32,U32 (ribose-2'-O)-methylase TrmJ
MGTTKPPSPTTDLSALRSAASKLSSLSLVQGLLRIAPGLPLAALAAVVIMFFAWSCEHRARQREAVEAQQIKKQSTEQISRLQQQASSALKDATESAQAAKELEGQRQQLTRQADALQQSLESLRKEELTHDSELASQSTEQVVKQVMARLQVAQALLPVPANSAARQNPPGGVPALLVPGNARASQKPQAGVPAPPGAPVPQNGAAALVLSDQGVRKVESAFLELDSCRQQSQVIAQQVSNCEQQTKLDSVLEEQQAGAISKLNAALADKDQILARSEAAHRAELKAVRGTWRTRLYHAAEIFAGGFIAGVLVR